MDLCGSIKKASGSSSPATDNIFDWGMWQFDFELVESGRRCFRQQRIEDGIHKTPPGDGFMWLQDGPTWKQVAW